MMQKFDISKLQYSKYRFIIIFIVSCLVGVTYLLIASLIFIIPNTKTSTPFSSSSSSSFQITPTSLEHIVFGIASNAKSWPRRKSYVTLWWRPKEMRGCVFLDQTNSSSLNSNDDNDNLPPICVSGDTSRFRYTFGNGSSTAGGLRSAIRVARVVSETVSLHTNYNVRWFVFGDDDTVFFPENLVKTLSKYDHGLWYYIGSNSEAYVQNKLNSYDMAFGGAGFAISYPLAKVLAKVFDACLDRYPHLYGSDARIHSCLAELGVSLTHEPGFHQMDMRGSMFGLLASHPLKPLVSLHHLEAMDPIFPKMTRIEALEHLFKAVRVDSQRIIQQTVCYERLSSWTISVSWGYAIQIFPRHVFLPDALRTQETYLPWRRGARGGIKNLYNIDMTTGYDAADPCRSLVFFLHNVSSSDRNGGIIMSTYIRTTMASEKNCTFDNNGLINQRKLEEIKVFSHKQEIDHKQLFLYLLNKLQAPRRHCCDVLPAAGSAAAGTIMEIAIRECGEEEQIYMHALT